jgi:hypothetical protein
MIRKTILALTAVTAMAAAALAPTSASAWHHHHHHRHGHGLGLIGPALVAGALLGTAAIAAGPSCYQRRWVETPVGWRKVRVYVC